MEDYKNFCSTIVTIPQYESTCWFNAILTSLLYSEYSRKLLLYEMNKGFDKTNKLLLIINKILLSLYIDNDSEKAQKYFNFIRPEVILSYLKGIENTTLKHMILDGWFSNIFLYKFIENIGRTCLVLDYYKDNLYAGITQSVDIAYDRLDGYIINYKYKYIQDIIDNISKIRNPDYICVNIWNDNVKKYPVFNSIFSKYQDLKSNFLLSKYDFTYEGLDECLIAGSKKKRKSLDKCLKEGYKPFKDIITFNGYKYKLDSCIVSNYNQYRSGYGHDIAGITCKNHKFVYNGWLKSTNDIGITDTERETALNNIPCKLIEYDWDIHKDDDRGVCIDLPNCTLENIKGQRQEKKQRFCFSFYLKKRKNVLIYVRMDPLETGAKYESLNKNLSKSPTSISSQRSLNSLYSVSDASPVSSLKGDELYVRNEYDDTDDEDIENEARYNIKYIEKYKKKIQLKKEKIYKEIGLIVNKEQRKQLKKKEIEEKKLGRNM